MRPLSLRHPSILAFALLLAGCSSGSDDDNDLQIACAGLTGATTSGGGTCAGNCGAAFTEAAADGDLGTYAILSAEDQMSGTVRIRATAQDGVTYPGGTPAAVVYGIVRTEGTSLGTNETLTTYLDGVMQESGNTSGTNGSTSGNRETGRRAFQTTLPFDAIELSYTQTSGTADVEVRVHEFCTSVN